MAVVIASDLGKDIAGEPLLRGISFKLERRDRMTLSGRNGAGKTTLLRMLAGEASVDDGELVFWQGGQGRAPRPAPAPRPRDHPARLHPLGRAASWWRSSRSWARWSRRWPSGAHDEATLGRYAEAQAGLEHAGGYDWRDRALATLHGLGFRDDADLDRSLDTFSGGELTRASLGRALAGAPDLLLLDEPTNHLDIESLEWLEAHLISPRCRHRARRARPLVPGGRGDLGARAGGGARQVLRRARGTRGARRRPRASWPWAGPSSASRPRSSAWSGS